MTYDPNTIRVQFTDCLSVADVPMSTPALPVAIVGVYTAETVTDGDDAVTISYERRNGRSGREEQTMRRGSLWSAAGSCAFIQRKVGGTWERVIVESKDQRIVRAEAEIARLQSLLETK